MTKDTKKQKDSDKQVTVGDKKLLQWHPAFYAGLQIEFGEEARKLIFEREHNLSTKPMQIDVLIIKKNTDDIIHKNIGRIFKRYNVVEYKSPTDYLSIDDFYKVYGYTCFYKSASEKVDNIKVTDVTITFVCRNYPKTFMKHLIKVRGLGVEKKGKGIYYINRDIIPMQLLVTSKLSEEENLWLRNLTNDLTDINSIEKISTEYRKHEHSELYKSVMDIIIRANEERFEEVKDMCEALRELFADELEMSRNEGIKESITEILADYGDVSDELKKKINEQTDLDILKKWLKLAARVSSIEEFESTI